MNMYLKQYKYNNFPCEWNTIKSLDYYDLCIHANAELQLYWWRLS